MAYAIIADIERLMAQINLGSLSRPNGMQVQSIIDDTEHEVNTALSSRSIDVPITIPAEFVGWLGLLVSYGATAAILKSMFPDATGPGESPAYSFWEARYRLGLKGIIDGALIPGSIPRIRKVRPSTYFTRNPAGEEDMGVHEPSFKRSMEF